jgi:tetratricopeptide (TPR) repeat protein
MLGRSTFAEAYADAALLADPGDLEGMALGIRALIRARQFDTAVERAAAYLLRAGRPDAELLAANASALFRVQRIDDAAAAYRQVVGLDALHAESHLRLGSGLLPPVAVSRPEKLCAAVDAAAAARYEDAVALLQQVLADEPGHPIAHRLLGETLFTQRAAASMASADPAFRALAAAMPRPDVRGLPIAQFVAGYGRLSPDRRRVVDRTAALFAQRLSRLVAIGGSHDLLGELERTTDAATRDALRGRRTFDGRVWDDVRGVGGIQAATGIEALDEAARFGFDTLAHEVAHQVHLYVFTPLQRARIRTLYQDALAEGRCLDYYAASNEAEYFGQGVEAFVSLGKRPGGETTHGHTRFELLAVDRPLHDFIASVVDWDPLQIPGARERLLEAAVGTALRCGRPQEAVTAASMLSPGPRREELLAAAVRAEAAARCH